MAVCRGIPQAEVAEQADASVSKTDGAQTPYRFDPGLRHADIAEWCNGNTGAFGARISGSNPGSAADTPVVFRVKLKAEGASVLFPR